MDLLVTKEKFRVEWKVILLDYVESPSDIPGNLEDGGNMESYTLEEEYQNTDAVMLKSLIDIGTLKDVENTTYISVVDEKSYIIQRIIYDLSKKVIYLDVEQLN